MKRSEIDKCRFYCPVCGHTMFFTLHQEEKICKWCNRKVRRPEKSVYDISFIKLLKCRYKLFLRNKEGI